MKKINILIIGLVIILTAVISSYLIFSNRNSEQISLEESKISKSEVSAEASLIINSGEGISRTFKAEFNKGITAFDLLKIGAEELNLTLKTKTYDIGVMIEAIGDKENGQDGKYWMYYINGEMPMVTVDKKEIRPGDKIEFKFEKSSF